MTPKQETQRQAVLTIAHHDYEKGLNAHAFFKVHNHALGEDLVQDTFIKTWSYLVKGGKIDIMKAFLYHILNNLIVDQYRKHKTISLDVLQEKGFEPTPPQGFQAPFQHSGWESGASLNCAPSRSISKSDANAVRSRSLATRNFSHHRAIKKRYRR